MFFKKLFGKNKEAASQQPQPQKPSPTLPTSEDENGSHFYAMKILLVGSRASRNIVLMKAYADGKVPDENSCSLGVDFVHKMIESPSGEKIMVTVWDTSSRDSYNKKVASSFYRGANGVCLCYDPSNPKTFELLKDIVENDYEKLSSPNVPVRVVGVSMAKDNEQAVPKNEVQALADRVDANVSSCCLDDMESVNALFSGFTSVVAKLHNIELGGEDRGDSKVQVNPSKLEVAEDSSGESFYFFENSSHWG